jgi:hypothetical protein
VSRSVAAIALPVVALLLTCTSAGAQQSGTGAEAKAMLERAIAALKSNEATALSEMNDKNNTQFHDRDLYVFCVTMADGKLTTTANPKLIGTDARTLKAGDDPFGQRIYDTMKSTERQILAEIIHGRRRAGNVTPRSVRGKTNDDADTAPDHRSQACRPQGLVLAHVQGVARGWH